MILYHGTTDGLKPCIGRACTFCLFPGKIRIPTSASWWIECYPQHQGEIS